LSTLSSTVTIPTDFSDPAFRADPYPVYAPLARLEGKIAINGLVQRYPNLKLTIPREQVPWRTAVAVRGVKALPARLA